MRAEYKLQQQPKLVTFGHLEWRQRANGVVIFDRNRRIFELNADDRKSSQKHLQRIIRLWRDCCQSILLRETTQIKTLTAVVREKLSSFLSSSRSFLRKSRGNEPFFFAFSLEITDDVLLEIAEQEDKTKCSWKQSCFCLQQKVKEVLLATQ